MDDWLAAWLTTKELYCFGIFFFSFFNATLLLLFCHLRFVATPLLIYLFFHKQQIASVLATAFARLFLYFLFSYYTHGLIFSFIMQDFDFHLLFFRFISLSLQLICFNYLFFGMYTFFSLHFK